MSNYDDDDSFAEKVIHQTAKLIAKETMKFQNQLHVEKKAREELQEKVIQLTHQVTEVENRLHAAEAEISAMPKHQHNRCEQVVQKVFAAGLLAIIPTDADNFCPPPSLDPQPTPTWDLITTQDSDTPGTSGTKRVYKSTTDQQNKKKKSKPNQNQKPPLCTTLDQVAEPLREQLKPFFKINKCATMDLLNDVQRSFVKFKTHQSNDACDTVTVSLVSAVIYEGIEYKIWYDDFNPSETTTFDKYLLSRLKNERKSLRRKSLVGMQQQLVHEYVAQIVQSEAEVSAEVSMEVSTEVVTD